MPEDLKPCPMCGKAVAKVTTSSEMFPEQDDEGNSESYAVVCDAHMPNGPGGCGASGGFAPTEAEAIAAWNRRAAPAAPDFCDGNCTWLDHAPGCVQAAPTAVEPEPVACRKLLKRLEWSIFNYDRYGDSQNYCPDCENLQQEGHKPDCELASLLAAPPRTPLTEAAVRRAARVLSDRTADACNIDREDEWNIYSDTHIEDARAALEAAASEGERK